jgi:hypothetical protein
MNIDKGSSSTYFQNSRSSRIALRAVTRSVSSMKAGIDEKPLAELYAEEDAMDPSDK